MKQLFLVPACNPNAEANIEKSLRKKINLKEIYDKCNPELQDVIREAGIQDATAVNIWGTTADKIQVWNKMEPGDGVLYYTKGEEEGFFQFYGTVLARIDSSEISEKVWGSSEFRYIHICENTPCIHLNKKAVFDFLDYKMNKVQGFMRVSQEKWESVRSSFEYMDEFVEYLFEIDELELGSRKTIETRMEVPKRRSAEKEERLMTTYYDALEKLRNNELEIKKQKAKEKPASINKPNFSANTGKSMPNFSKINLIKEGMGKLGEEIVCHLERTSLIDAGKEDLAQKVEIVSEKSNQYGYDILSYDASGKEKHIEVKSTSKGKESSFELTWREWEGLQEDENFMIIRIYNLRLQEDSIAYEYYILNSEDKDKIKAEPLVYRVYY